MEILEYEANFGILLVVSKWRIFKHIKATFLHDSDLIETADTVFLVGARLNWMLHFGQPPRWNHKVNIIQVNNNVQHVNIKYCT
jgi:hypothetical protein